MKISLDLDKTRELNDLYHSLDEKDRKELHLTDGLYCPLKAYCRVKGVKAVWTRKTKVRFRIGEDLHGEFELPFKHREVEVKLGYAVGHPDVVLKVDRLPIGEDNKFEFWQVVEGPLEFKHTTLTIRSLKDIPSKWTDQLRLECIYTKTTRGWLAILEVVSGFGTVWKIDFDEPELAAVKIDHVGFIELIATAIQARNPAILLPKRKECSTCQYNHELGCPAKPGLKREGS